uniref:U1 small nuclear ribonucleoprotein C n=1 Tax=Nelumbo nucifera TaxID=4432 RepID=A0A822Y0B9_NELNU|nr:TPA_asm: hypothetical protein HUJ06_026160 [Nelumbo nucifera]
MPRYYCDYCDTYLTHDSPSVRKQHNAGYKHKQFEEQQTQSLIDQRIKEHLGQTAAFQQVGAAYNQHLTSFPANPQRPRLPILPTPVLPTGAPQVPGTSLLIPGIRPPVLPRPVAGPPGYAVAPSMPSVLGPSGTPLPMPVNGLPRPPTINAPTTVPGGTAAPAPTSNGAPSMVTPAIYQANPTTATSGGFDSFNTTAASGLQRPSPSGTTAPSTTSTASQDGFTYGQNAEANH